MKFRKFIKISERGRKSRTVRPRDKSLDDYISEADCTHSFGISLYTHTHTPRSIILTMLRYIESALRVSHALQALPSRRYASTEKLNTFSSVLTSSRVQGASQAMLHAVGLNRADMSRPQIGICSVWWEGNPCNAHLLGLSERVKTGVSAAGMVGLRFNTIGVSDGISMGTRGMTYSLPSRELIADSVETVLGAQWYDGSIVIPGCDKNMVSTSSELLELLPDCK
jgi:hypothetical protein